MTEIKPFPAITYNFNKLNQPHKVICPPYDIITPNAARSYRRLSGYNMIHLTLPEYTINKNQYQRSAYRFHNWLKKGILLQDKEPAIYFYLQEFKTGERKESHRGKGYKFRRVGFIACLSLFNSSFTHGHEYTRIEAKEDRFKLLAEVRANLEPIFVLFPDPQRFAQNIFRKYVLPNKPLIRFQDHGKNMNILWKVVDPNIIKKIKAKMENKPIFIADGHHRYEVSLNYQDLMRKTLNRPFQGNEDFNYIMTYFCPIESPDLIIRPVHRLVKGIDHFPIDKFKKFFYIRKTTKSKLISLIRSRTKKRRLIGMYGNKKFYILILKDYNILNKIEKSYRSLDISLLNYLVLSKLLGVDPKDKNRVIFNANVQNLIRQADMDKTSLIFFLKPVRISNITHLAGMGKKMPTKTTYFYPKVPSGLVVYKFKKSQ